MTNGHLMAKTNFMENVLTKIKVSLSERKKNSELEEVYRNIIFEIMVEGKNAEVFISSKNLSKLSELNRLQHFFLRASVRIEYSYQVQLTQNFFLFPIH